MTKLKFKSEKLVRDNTIERSDESGINTSWSIVSPDLHKKLLKDKLIEECEEVVSADSLDEMKHEIADVFEVLESICAINSIELSEIYEIQKEKKIKRGSFLKGIYLSCIEIDSDNEFANYYLNQPKKYPQI